MMSDDRSPMITGAAYGALPLFTQTSGCAEIFAAAIALSLACPPVVIATDYAQLLTGWDLGEGAFTHPNAKNAEAWRFF